jgi:hypothetical protein
LAPVALVQVLTAGRVFKALRHLFTQHLLLAVVVVVTEHQPLEGLEAVVDMVHLFRVVLELLAKVMPAVPEVMFSLQTIHAAEAAVLEQLADQ